MCVYVFQVIMYWMEGAHLSHPSGREKNSLVSPSCGGGFHSIPFAQTHTHTHKVFGPMISGGSCGGNVDDQMALSAQCTFSFKLLLPPFIPHHQDHVLSTRARVESMSVSMSMCEGILSGLSTTLWATLHTTSVAAFTAFFFIRAEQEEEEEEGNHLGTFLSCTSLFCSCMYVCVCWYAC